MKTAVVEGRVDVRDLATCADYFIQQGLPAQNKSDLMFRIITTFAHGSLAQGARRFESTEEALGFMFEIGLGPVNRVVDKRSGRRANSWTLSNAIAEENRADSHKQMPSDEEFREAAKIAMRNVQAMIDEGKIEAYIKEEGLANTDLLPAQRASLTAEADAEQAARMKEFISGLKQPGQSPEKGE